MSGSSNVTLARPVRRPPNSCLSAPTAPFMRFSISRLSKLPDVISVLFVFLRLSSVSLDLCFAAAFDNAAKGLAAEEFCDCVFLVQREYHNRDAVIAGERDSRRVHDFEIAAEDVRKA